jgi:hypothetical protein
MVNCFAFLVTAASSAGAASGAYSSTLTSVAQNKCVNVKTDDENGGWTADCPGPAGIVLKLYAGEWERMAIVYQGRVYDTWDLSSASRRTACVCAARSKPMRRPRVSARPTPAVNPSSPPPRRDWPLPPQLERDFAGQVTALSADYGKSRSRSQGHTRDPE